MTIDEARERLAHPVPVDRRGRKLTTYSQWDAFLNCRQKAEWRYVRHLVPTRITNALNIGSVNHDALECWYDTGDEQLTLSVIDDSYPNKDERRHTDHQNWHLSRAMLAGYTKHYTPEEFEMIATEIVFEGEVRNPITGARSRSFVIGGKVDGIAAIDRPGRHPTFWLVEHKNWSSLPADSLTEWLWQDFQTTLYADYIQEVFGIPISGVIYNVLIKSLLKQGEGETEEEFKARKNELAINNKTGKSAAKRKIAETDDAFHSRMVTKYSNPNMYHRERLFIDRGQFLQVRYQLWIMTQQWLYAIRHDQFYMNSSYCFRYGRKPCAYYQLCKHGEDEDIINAMYENREPHEELRTDLIININQEKTL